MKSFMSDPWLCHFTNICARSVCCGNRVALGSVELPGLPAPEPLKAVVLGYNKCTPRRGTREPSIYFNTPLQYGHESTSTAWIQPRSMERELGEIFHLQGILQDSRLQKA